MYNQITIELDETRKGAMVDAVKERLSLMADAYTRAPYIQLLQSLEAASTAVVLTSHTGIMECLIYSMRRANESNPTYYKAALADRLICVDKQGSMCKKSGHIQLTLDLQNKISTCLSYPTFN